MCLRTCGYGAFDQPPSKADIALTKCLLKKLKQHQAKQRSVAGRSPVSRRAWVRWVRYGQSPGSLRTGTGQVSGQDNATAFYRRTVYGHRVKKNVIICARLDLYVK